MGRRGAGLVCGTFALAVGLSGCASSHDTGTDRQAHIIALAMSYPRQSDANGLARAALALWRGAPNQLAILESTDLSPSTASQPAARVVIRIHVPMTENTGFGDASQPAHDACYRLDFLMPSSSLQGEPQRIDCPPGARPITLPPAPPEPHLPADASTRLARSLETLPEHPSLIEAITALRRSFPSMDVRVSAEVVGDRVAVAAGIAHLNDVECVVALRTGHHVEAIYPDPRTLMPGESGCVADQAIHPITTH
ncbi:MAG: hypothetical protein ACTHJM_16820 [Marmoricola sp.]